MTVDRVSNKSNRSQNKSGSIFASRYSNISLFFSLCLGLTLSSYSLAATLANQSANLSVNNYSDDDLNVSSTSLFVRKTLQDDTLSLKLSYQDIQIEDSYQDQENNAPKYSESQTIFSLGADYMYYDSSLSLNTDFTSADSSSMFNVGFNFIQEFKNGANAIRMGFNHGWEDDSDLALHNKSRNIHIGSEISLRQTWRLYSGIELSSSDGDLESFFSARRFDSITRTDLPDGKSDRTIKLISSNDLGKNRFLNSEFSMFKNDWKQSGNSLTMSLLKIRSDRFSTTTHARIFKKSESDFYLSDVIAPTQTFYSDHRTLAKQTSKELGITGHWKFKTNPDKRFKNIQLDAGYSLIDHEYSTEAGIANNGNLLHLNLAGNY